MHGFPKIASEKPYNSISFKHCPNTYIAIIASYLAIDMKLRISIIIHSNSLSMF